MKNRIELMFRGRFWISLIFSAGGVALALLVNVSVAPCLLLLAFFQMTVNQPYLWLKTTSVRPAALARLHIYADLMVYTAAIHLFGGAGSGPLLAGYILIITQASVTISPREGVYAAVASAALISLVVALERTGVVSGFPPLYSDESGPLEWAMTGLVTAVIFMAPALVGYYVFDMLGGRQREIKRAYRQAFGVFDQASDALIAIDMNGDIVRANPKASELLRRPPEDLKGAPLDGFLPPETLDEFAVIIQDASTGERVTANRMKLPLEDQAPRYLRVTASPVYRRDEQTGTFLAIQDVTEQALLEEELKRNSEELYRRVEERTVELEESRERFAALFEKAAVPLCWLDAEGRLQSGNPPFFEVTGLSAEDEGGLKLTGILRNEIDEERVNGYLENLRKGHDAPSRLELKIERADGSGLAWTEWFIRFDPLTDLILVSMIDITERKQAESRLRESETRFKLLFDRVFDAILVTDDTGKIIDANLAARRILGYGRDELKALNILDLVPESERKSMREAGRRALDNKIDHMPRMELIAKGGERRLVEAGAVALDHGDGAMILASFRDITERHQAEQALRESEERYRRLVETSPDAIVMAALDTSIVMANERAVDVFRAESTEELLGKSATDLLTPADIDRAEQNVRKVLEYGSLQGIEYRVTRLDGTEFAAEVSASLIRDIDGNPSVFISTIRDITMRKMIETELDQYRQNLEEEVEKRSAETIEQREFLQKVIESAYDMIFVLDESGDYILANRAIQEMTDPAVRIEPGQSSGLAVHPEDLSSAREGFRVALSGKQAQLELRVKGRAGDYRQMVAKLSPLVWHGERRVLGVASDVTEQRRAREELVKSEERYRLLAENATDVIWTAALPDLKIGFVSPSVERLRGYSPEEVMKQNLSEIFTPHSLDRAKAVLAEELAADRRGERDPNRVHTIELQQKTKDGGVVWTEERIVFLRDESGAPAGLLGVTRDIDQRREAENELQRYKEHLEDLVEQRTAELTETNRRLRREIAERVRAEDGLAVSEKKYRSLFETSMDVVYVSSREGRLLDINPAGVKISGYAKDELLGMDVRNLYRNPEQRDGFRAAVEANGVVKDFELQMTAKSGRVLDCLVTASVIIDPDEGVTGYRGIIKDVTERNRAVEALRASEERFRALIENARDVISILDENGIITYESPSIERVLGYKPEEMIGRRAFEFNHPDEAAIVAKDLERGLGRPGGTVELEMRIRHKDGSWRGFEALATNMLHHPHIKGFVINSRDVTYQEEMEKVQRELQEMLVEAKQMAAAGGIAAGVAHEMNNPLTAISYYADALAGIEGLEDEDREKVSRIQEAAERITKLTSNLINFASTAEARFESVNLSDLIEQGLDASRHELERKPGVRIELKLEQGLPPIGGSPRHLFHLVSNLVSNALHALPDDRGVVTIETAAKDGAVELSVSDTGVGIPEADLPEIFNPFFTRRRGGRGSGLGLAIVNQVARLHHAGIEVESKEGAGSRFLVTFSEMLKPPDQD